MSHYVILALIIFGFNLLPAFAPPTWVVLVVYRLNSHLMTLPMVIIGAVMATLGRYCLALITVRMKSYIPAKQLENLASTGVVLEKYKKSATIFEFAFFAVSPFPSAQMFEAAGLIGLNLRRLTIAFFFGRLISYSIYVTGAGKFANTKLNNLVKDTLFSPYGLILQIACIAGVISLTRIDWRRMVKK